MQKVDFAIIIQETISRCNQNRIGAKPAVFVTLAPVLSPVPWRNDTAEEFIRRFLYEVLLTSDADANIELSLTRRALLADINAFLGILPRYWIQLRISGRGLRIAETMVEELFSEVGLREEEWLGVAGSGARLGIFSSIDGPKIKMVFGIEAVRNKQKCDLLLPILDNEPMADLLAGGAVV